MGYYWGSNDGFATQSGSITRSYKISYTVPCDRIGPGSWAAIIYILPLISALVAVAILDRKVKRLT